ncbi:hypothetical protein TNCV_979421 [Trichonephila clavipes]|nr:hypothetical protein TNCV_979421 [Trichonephila clavipes]
MISHTCSIGDTFGDFVGRVQRTAIPGTKTETVFNRNTQQISTPSSHELWIDTTGVTNDNDLESAEFRISDADAVKCAIATHRIWQSALSEVSRGLQEPGLLEAVPSLHHYSQQSCTVDIFWPSHFAISWKENTPFRSPIK